MKSCFARANLSKSYEVGVRPLTAFLPTRLCCRRAPVRACSRFITSKTPLRNDQIVTFDLNAAVAQREAVEKAAAAASARALVRSAAKAGDTALALAAVGQLASAGGALSADDFRVLIVSQLQTGEPHAAALAEAMLRKAADAGLLNDANLLQARALLHVARGEAVKGGELLRSAATQCRDACAGGARSDVPLRQAAVADHTGFMFGTSVATLDQLLRSSAGWNTAARQRGAYSSATATELFNDCCTAFAARALQLQRMQLSIFRDIRMCCSSHTDASYAANATDSTLPADVTALLCVERARQHDFWALQLLCLETARHLVHAGTPLAAAEALRTAADVLAVLAEQHRSALAAAVEDWAESLLKRRAPMVPVPVAKGARPATHDVAAVSPRDLLSAMLPLSKPPTSTFNAWVWAWEQAHERGQAQAGTAASEVARLVAVMSTSLATSRSGGVTGAGGQDDPEVYQVDDGASAAHGVPAPRDAMDGWVATATRTSSFDGLEAAAGTMSALLEPQLRAWEAAARNAGWMGRGSSLTRARGVAAGSASLETAVASAVAELAAASGSAAALAASSAFLSVPDQVTFNHYLSLISASGFAEEASRVPELMASAGVPPNASTYETLLRAAMRNASKGSQSTSSASAGSGSASDIVGSIDAGAGDAAAATSVATGGNQTIKGKGKGNSRGDAAPLSPGERAAAHTALEDAMDGMIMEALGRGIRLSPAMVTMRLRASAEAGCMARAARTLRLAEEHGVPLLSGALSSLLLGFATAGRMDAAVHLFAHMPGVLPPFAPADAAAAGCTGASRAGSWGAASQGDHLEEDHHDDADDGSSTAVSLGDAADAKARRRGRELQPGGGTAVGPLRPSILPIRGAPLADATTFRTMCTALLRAGYLHDAVDLLEAFGVHAQGQPISEEKRGDQFGRAARRGMAAQMQAAWLLDPSELGSGSSASDAHAARLVDVSCLPRLLDTSYAIMMRGCLGVAAAHLGLVPPGTVAAANVSDCLPVIKGGVGWFRVQHNDHLRARIFDTGRLLLSNALQKPRDSLLARFCPDESAWQNSLAESAVSSVQDEATIRETLARLMVMCKRRQPHAGHFRGPFDELSWKKLEQRLC